MTYFFVLVWEQREVLTVGRRKKYTRKALSTAVQAYFDSITREIVITERVPTGKKDSYGHEIYEIQDVKNNLGEVAKKLQYLVPPTLEGLCLHIGIVSSTWSRWRDADKYPEFQEIIEQVDERIIGWLKEQVVTRDKVTGVVWALEVNHGCGQKNQNADKDVTVTIEGGDPAWRS